MVSSTSSSPILRPSSSPNLSRSLTRQLTPPVPARIRCRDPVPRISAGGGARASPETTRSPPSTSGNSLYEILGISMGARSDEIKAAYRRLARIWHPDVAVAGETTGSSTSGTDGDEFIRIHEAYSILSDPDKRADYDRKLVRWRIRPLQGSFNGVSASASSSFCQNPRRNWETDQCW